MVLFPLENLSFAEECTYQYLWWWSCDGGQDVDALCGEVATLTGASGLAEAPARIHDGLSILLVQNDQVALLEVQER